MKKKIVLGIGTVLLSVLIILLVNAQSLPCKSIGNNVEMKFESVMQGMAQHLLINSIPGAGQTMQAIQIAQCFAGGIDKCVLGMGMAQLESAAWSEIGKHISPEAVQIVQNVKDICGNAKDLEIENANTKDASLSGTINTKDSLGKDISLSMTNAGLNYDKEKKQYSFTTKTDSEIKIEIKDAQGKEKTVTYSNMKEGGVLKVDSQGNVFEADLVSSQATSFEFGNQKIDVPANMQVIYKDNKITLKPAKDKDEKEFEFDFSLLDKEGKTSGIASKIRSDGEITIGENQVTGKHFWIREAGIAGRDAEITAIKENAIVTFDPANYKHLTIQDAELKNNDIKIATTTDPLKIYLDGVSVPKDVRNGVSFKSVTGDVENLEIRAENMKITKLGKQFNIEFIVRDGKILPDPKSMTKEIKNLEERMYIPNKVLVDMEISGQKVSLFIDEKDQAILASDKNIVNVWPKAEVKNEEFKGLDTEPWDGPFVEKGFKLAGVPRLEGEIKVRTYSKEGKDISRTITYDFTAKSDASKTGTEIILQNLGISGKTLETLKRCKNCPGFSEFFKQGLKENSRLHIDNFLPQRAFVLRVIEASGVRAIGVAPYSREESDRILEQALEYAKAGLKETLIDPKQVEERTKELESIFIAWQKSA